MFSQLHHFLKPLPGHPPVENRTKQARPRDGVRREGRERRRRKCCFCVVSALRNSCLPGTEQLLVQSCVPPVQPWLGSSDNRHRIHRPCTQHSDPSSAALWDLLKMLQSSSPFVQPDPTPKLQLIGPEVGTGRVQPICPFLGIMTRQRHTLTPQDRTLTCNWEATSALFPALRPGKEGVESVVWGRVGRER